MRDSAELAARLERIKRLVADLLKVQTESSESHDLAARITREVDAARADLRILDTRPSKHR